MVAVLSAQRVVPREEDPGAFVVERISALKLRPSPLRPHCLAGERLHLWKGVNTPPSPVIDNPLLRHLASLAIQASLKDPSSYGSGLKKFHIFCDVFSISEEERLPASTELIYSFLLWVVSDPDPDDPAFRDGTPFESVSITTARKYMSAIRAWHIAQNWPLLSRSQVVQLYWRQSVDWTISKQRLATAAAHHARPSHW